MREARAAEAAEARESAADRVEALAAERLRLAGRIEEAMALLGEHSEDLAALDRELLSITSPPTDLRMRLTESTHGWVNRCGFARLGAAWPGPAVLWQDNPPSVETLMQAPALELAEFARDDALVPARKSRGGRLYKSEPAGDPPQAA